MFPVHELERAGPDIASRLNVHKVLMKPLTATSQHAKSRSPPLLCKPSSDGIQTAEDSLACIQSSLCIFIPQPLSPRGLEFPLLLHLHQRKHPVHPQPLHSHLLKLRTDLPGRGNSLLRREDLGTTSVHFIPYKPLMQAVNREQTSRPL